MEQIQTLSSLRGRSLLRDIYRELRFEKQMSELTVLGICWRLCVYEKDIFRYSRYQATVVHSLGFLSGSSLWLQEIVNRFNYATINSLVYFGAAVLLVIIGLRRFGNLVGNELVVGAIVLEALLLMTMFVVMFFSPSDDMATEQLADSEPVEESETQQLIREIGEIGSDYAGFTTQMDEITSALSSLIARQDELIASVNDMARYSAQAVSPQPELLHTMQQTTSALREFNRVVGEFADAARTLRREEIQQAVRFEVERLLLSPRAQDQVPNTKE